MLKKQEACSENDFIASGAGAFDYNYLPETQGGGAYSHILPIRVCATGEGVLFKPFDLVKGMVFKSFGLIKGMVFKPFGLVKSMIFKPFGLV